MNGPSDDDHGGSGGVGSSGSGAGHHQRAAPSPTSRNNTPPTSPRPLRPLKKRLRQEHHRHRQSEWDQQQWQAPGTWTSEQIAVRMKLWHPKNNGNGNCDIQHHYPIESSFSLTLMESSSVGSSSPSKRSTTTDIWELMQSPPPPPPPPPPSSSSGLVRQTAVFFTDTALHSQQLAEHVASVHRSWEEAMTKHQTQQHQRHQHQQQQSKQPQPLVVSWWNDHPRATASGSSAVADHDAAVAAAAAAAADDSLSLSPIPVDYCQFGQKAAASPAVPQRKRHHHHHHHHDDDDDDDDELILLQDECSPAIVLYCDCGNNLSGGSGKDTTGGGEAWTGSQQSQRNGRRVRHDGVSTSTLSSPSLYPNASSSKTAGHSPGLICPATTSAVAAATAAAATAGETQQQQQQQKRLLPRMDNSSNSIHHQKVAPLNDSRMSIVTMTTTKNQTSFGAGKTSGTCSRGGGRHAPSASGDGNDNNNNNHPDVHDNVIMGLYGSSPVKMGFYNPGGNSGTFNHDTDYTEVLPPLQEDQDGYGMNDDAMEYSWLDTRPPRPKQQRESSTEESHRSSRLAGTGGRSNSRSSEKSRNSQSVAVLPHGGGRGSDDDDDDEDDTRHNPTKCGTTVVDPSLLLKKNPRPSSQGLTGSRGGVGCVGSSTRLPVGPSQQRRNRHKMIINGVGATSTAFSPRTPPRTVTQDQQEDVVKDVDDEFWQPHGAAPFTPRLLSKKHSTASNGTTSTGASNDSACVTPTPMDNEEMEALMEEETGDGMDHVMGTGTDRLEFSYVVAAAATPSKSGRKGRKKCVTRKDLPLPEVTLIGPRHSSSHGSIRLDVDDDDDEDNTASSGMLLKGAPSHGLSQIMASTAISSRRNMSEKVLPPRPLQAKKSWRQLKCLPYSSSQAPSDQVARLTMISRASNLPTEEDKIKQVLEDVLIIPPRVLPSFTVARKTTKSTQPGDGENVKGVAIGSGDDLDSIYKNAMQQTPPRTNVSSCKTSNNNNIDGTVKMMQASHDGHTWENGMGLSHGTAAPTHYQDDQDFMHLMMEDNNYYSGMQYSRNGQEMAYASAEAAGFLPSGHRESFLATTGGGSSFSSSVWRDQYHASQPGQSFPAIGETFHHQQRIQDIFFSPAGFQDNSAFGAQEELYFNVSGGTFPLKSSLRRYQSDGHQHDHRQHLPHQLQKNKAPRRVSDFTDGRSSSSPRNSSNRYYAASASQFGPDYRGDPFTGSA